MDSKFVMNATPHTVIGYALVRSIFTGSFLSAIVGCMAAFIGHIVLDLVNESNGIRTTKERIWLDIVPTAALGMLVAFFGYYLGGWNLLLVELGLFLLGSIFGNMPDIIDKFFYLAIIYPKKYKFTYYFHFKFKPPINPPGWVTRFIGWFMVFVMIVILVIKTIY